jgi:hypothetical protein
MTNKTKVKQIRKRKLILISQLLKIPFSCWENSPELTEYQSLTKELFLIAQVEKQKNFSETCNQNLIAS